jgi:hypothetical protein
MEIIATVGILASFGVYLVERLLASKRVEARLAYELERQLEAQKQEMKAEMLVWGERIENIQTRLNKMELRGR